jgi:hypothetical protein
MTDCVFELFEYDSVRCYFFNEPPPADPKLYFKQKTLWELMVYGTLSCPKRPQYTVFPADGQIGRWTMHYDNQKLATMREIARHTPFTRIRDELIDLLPGMHMRYHDFDTNTTTVWTLTDDVIMREHDNHLRLGVWPD